MKAEILGNGMLAVTPTNETEVFAIQQWAGNTNMAFCFTRELMGTEVKPSDIHFLKKQETGERAMQVPPVHPVDALKQFIPITEEMEQQLREYCDQTVECTCIMQPGCGTLVDDNCAFHGIYAFMAEPENEKA